MSVSASLSLALSSRLTASTMNPLGPEAFLEGWYVTRDLAGNTAAARSCGVSHPWLTMPSMTYFQRASALAFCDAPRPGSKNDGPLTTDASSAPSDGVSLETSLLK